MGMTQRQVLELDFLEFLGTFDLVKWYFCNN